MSLNSRINRFSTAFALVVPMLLFVLAGCGGDDKPPDADRDGTADASDCAPQDAQAWRELTFASRDEDTDGFRVNVGGQLCAGVALPSNRSAMLATGGDVDCDDGNALKWASRHYEAVDTDRDGFGVAGAGDICTGAALPAGLIAALPATNDLDCDDANAQKWAARRYEAVDSDGDGFGVASSGVICTGAALPAGLIAALPGTIDLDCDDANASDWRLLSFASRDNDGDGYRINVSGTHCGQNTLPGYLNATATTDQLVDCDDSDVARWRRMAVYRDADGDGAGGGVALRECIGNTPASGYALTGYDPLDDPTDPAAAATSTFALASSVLAVPDETDDDDVF